MGDQSARWLRVIQPGLVEATRVLSQLTNRSVRLRHATLWATGSEPGPEADGAAIHIEGSGPWPVEAVLWLPQDLAVPLVEAVVQQPAEWPVSGLAESALLELGNVLFTAFFNVLADLLRVSWPVTPPRLLNPPERDRWFAVVRTHVSAVAFKVRWDIDGVAREALLMFRDQPDPRARVVPSSASAESWERMQPDPWERVWNTSVWYPLALRWATTWANRFSDPHWAQIVVQTLPFTVASLWRVTSDKQAEVLAAKGYRLMPGTVVGITDPHHHVIAAACQWRVPVADPHERVFPLMRHLTEATRVLAIPLQTVDGVVGVLTVGAVDETQWSDGLSAIVQDFSPLLAQALEQHERLKELERHAALFRWMNRVVATVWDPAAGYRVRHNEVQAPFGMVRPWRREWPRLVGIYGGLWVFWDAEHDRWRITDAWGPWTFQTRELYNRWWPRLRRWLLAGDEDSRTRGWRTAPHPAALGDGLVYWYPIREGDRVIGGGVLWIPDGPHTDNGVLDSLLDVVGMALVAVRRQRQLTRQSLRDPLTDALNRRGLERAVEELLSARPARTALFCVVDLDRFKPVNDTWGHAAGDRLLVEWARFVQQSLRTADWVARIGGDEFVWVLVDSQWSEAVKRRLRHLIIDGPLAHYGAGASVGVVEIPREANNFSDAYRLADQRLYQGKTQGRSRIVGPDGDVTLVNA